MTSKNNSEIAIIYDGECPFCSNYVKLLRIREAAENVSLINAREKHPLVKLAIEKGFDLNDGMVTIVDGKYYFGADSVHVLSLLSTNSGIFNKLNHFIFRSRYLSKALYPILKSGRNLTLKLLGRKKIGAEKKSK